ncbi:MAG: SDR family oxidoreductase [Muribaculum sp.]|nr:SDR family oxidoreductase [Muribaculaceae bacterium]MCM1080130.1 SDR family oxidoreductase [Muribaculum sp.]
MLHGKNAIVTGARSGIGLAIVRLFASKGCNMWVVTHTQSDEFLSEIALLQSQYGVWIKAVHMDLLSEESIKEGYKLIQSDKLPIDILVNGAGMVSPDRLFAMTRMDDIRNVMQVNFLSALQLTQLVLRPMMRQKSGSIINIASIAAYGDDTSQMEYAASKAALVAATKKLGRELGRSGIRVNAVAPGLTYTKMLDNISDETLDNIKNGLPFKRLGTAEEVAEVCMFLASDVSSIINGETIRADGGGFDLRLSNNK